jgi:hypothetical protein
MATHRSSPSLLLSAVAACLAIACGEAGERSSAGDMGEGASDASSSHTSPTGGGDRQGAGGSTSSTATGTIGDPPATSSGSTASSGTGGAPAGPSSSRLTPRPTGSTSAPLGFYEYVPPGYPNTGDLPLLVALHGIGENGDGSAQLGSVIGVGIGRLLATDAWPSERPFVVLVPQHPGGGCPSGAEIQSFIAWGIDNYQIDPKRVYLTGLSCGGIGAWSYLGENLDGQIAAMVPIAGDGVWAWNARGCDLGKVAIWAFHGDQDLVVGPSGTHVPMDGLATCASPPRKEAKKTIYAGVDHGSWDRTYDLSAGHDIYAWMLDKVRD